MIGGLASSLMLLALKRLAPGYVTDPDGVARSVHEATEELAREMGLWRAP